jgi:hypothetical protein
MSSERSGNSSFQQFFPDHKNIAGILDGRGWQLADKGRYEWIDPIETFVLRSHEFPLVALDLEKRFHDFHSIGRAQFQGQETTQIAMKDQLGHPSSAYFSLTSDLLVGITDTNARPGGGHKTSPSASISGGEQTPSTWLATLRSFPVRRRMSST